MVITRAGLGLRIAELAALRVQDVDLLRRTVRIEWQLWLDGKRRVPPNTKITTDVGVAERVADSATARTEGPTQKPGRCGRQTSTAGSITATSSKTASATHKAVS